MKPHTIIQRYPDGHELKCSHHDPSIAATWELRRAITHDWDQPTYRDIDGGLARDMEHALELGEAAVAKASGGAR